MSRSYKKHPVAPDKVGYNSKRLANRKVRRSVNRGEELLKGKSYRKLYDSWDIHDYIEYGDSFETFYQRALTRWQETGYYPGGRGKRHDAPPSREYCKNIYDRWYRRK